MVTALFADIKDSMRLMEQLDPEDARAIVDPALRLMIDAVHRFDGYVVQSTGDGIFALFGAPIAHENHPQLGLYAAIWLQQEIKRYAQKLREEGMATVEIRVGLNTGEAVVRPIRISDRDMEFAPIGQVAGLAERMQSLAPTGSIVVTEHVHRLTEGYFEFKALGPARIKGLSESINVYEVLGHGPLRTRLEASAARGLSKFVGRQSELDGIARALELAKAGHGQVIAVVGEAGMGKSRLFREFKSSAQSGCMWLEVLSEPYGRTLSYVPVVELLKSFFGITDQDDERQRREKVLAGLVALGLGLESSAPYLLALLGVSRAIDTVARMDEEIKRRRTLDAVNHLLLRKSLDRPLVIILEDLHRIDAETRSLLDLLVDSIQAARILLLVNYRPEYHHQWADRSCYSELRLDPLNQKTANELLSALLGDAAALESTKRLIIDKTEGNPFFIEETVQILFEEGILVGNGTGGIASSPEEIKIPPTVQAILAARIDRLSPAAKGLLQTLAVLGRRFQFELVKRLVQKPEDDLRSMLFGLQQAKFLDEQPALPGLEYFFKHALTQEVAYKSLLIQQRRQLHEATGAALETLFAERLEDHLAELAHHYSHSSNVGKAVDYLRRAGAQARQRSSHSEAIDHLTTGLKLLSGLRDARERVRLELGLQIGLAQSLAVIKGYNEAEGALNRALELGSQAGDADQLLISALYLLRTLYLTKGESRKSLETSRELLVLAERESSPDSLVIGHYSVGQISMFRGELASARENLERANTIAASAPLASTLTVAAENPRILILSPLSWVLSLLGYPDQGRERGRESLAVTHGSSHLYWLSWSHMFQAYLGHFLRDMPLAQEHAEPAVEIATQNGFSQWAAWSFVSRGWTLVVGGQADEGLAEIRRGFARLQTMRSGMFVLLRAVLADACARSGRVQEGLSEVGEAIRAADSSGERLCEAELFRIKGALLLIQDDANRNQAERCFRHAIDIARAQSAKLWELRATTSLARLLASDGRIDEARRSLAEIYHWFTEGFDTADIKEAQELLVQLRE